MSIEGFDDADFEDIAPVSGKPSRADLVMRVIRPRSGTGRKIQFNVAASVLAEIGVDAPRARIAVAWSAQKRAFRLKPEKNGAYEIMAPIKGQGRNLIRAPLPAGLFENEGTGEPEFYVDAIGKLIIVECPELFLRPNMKMLPAPAKSAGEPSREAPRHPGAPVDDDKVLRAALGLSGSMPRVIDGQEFPPAEAQIVALLARRQLITKQAILIATADPEKPGEDDRSEKIVDVYLCKIRPKLQAMGITVKTDWGNGYGLSQTDRTKLQNLIELAKMEAQS